MSSAWQHGKDAAVRDSLLRACQRSRERAEPPIVNKATFRWPVAAPVPAGIEVEEYEYYVEPGAQGWVPLRIVKPAEAATAAGATTSIAAAVAAAEAAEAADAAEAAEAVQAAEAPDAAADEAAADGGEVEDDELPKQLSEETRSDAAPKLRRRRSKWMPPPPMVRRPVIIFMHATGESMDHVRAKQELFARMGYLTAAIDARYHGQRAAVPADLAAAVDAAASAAGPAGVSRMLAGGAASVSGDTESGAAADEAAAEKARATKLKAAAAASKSVMAAVKGLDAKTLSALERADAAAGLAPGGSFLSGFPAGPEFGQPPGAPASLRSPSPTAAGEASAGGGTETGSGRTLGAHEAAAAAEAARRDATRRAAHTRFLDAWIGAAAEFRARRGAAATAAAMATAPLPEPAASAEGGGGGGRPAAAAAARGRGPAAPAAAGDRLTPRNVYEMALVAAWRGSGERPFLLDTVWDVVVLLDILVRRRDVDPTRIGMTGVSLGGMFTWLTAAADARVAVAAPVMGVQAFGWALQAGAWAARADSIPLVFEVAADDLAAAADRERRNGGHASAAPAPALPAAVGATDAAGRAKVTAEVVRAVWEKLLPGLLTDFDGPGSLPLIPLRPLLVATGELDPRCPLAGVELAVGAARARYEAWARHLRAQAKRSADMEAGMRDLAAAEAAYASERAAADDAEEAAVAAMMALAVPGPVAEHSLASTAGASRAALSAQGSSSSGGGVAVGKAPAGGVQKEASGVRAEASRMSVGMQAPAAEKSGASEAAGAGADGVAAAESVAPGSQPLEVPVPGEVGAITADFGGAAAVDGGEGGAGVDGPAATPAPEASLRDRFIVPPCTSDADWDALDSRRKAVRAAARALQAQQAAEAAARAAAEAAQAAEASMADATAAAMASRAATRAAEAAAWAAAEDGGEVGKAAPAAGEEVLEDPAAVAEAAAAAAQAAAAAAATAQRAAQAAAEAAEAAAAVAAAAAHTSAEMAAVVEAEASALFEEASRLEQEAVDAMVGEKLKLVVEVGVGHTETAGMQRAVEGWMHKHLLWPWKAEQQVAAAAVAAATASALAAAVEAEAAAVAGP